MIVRKLPKIQPAVQIDLSNEEARMLVMILRNVSAIGVAGRTMNELQKALEHQAELLPAHAYHRMSGYLAFGDNLPLRGDENDPA